MARRRGHSYEVMTGGYSRLLARAESSGRRDGERRAATFVLRGDPPPDRSLIHTDRGRRVGASCASSTTAGCARRGPTTSTTTGEHLGTPAIVLEHSEAHVVPPHAARGRRAVDGLQERLAEAAASFHTIPLDALPASLARPACRTTTSATASTSGGEAADHGRGDAVPALRRGLARRPPAAAGAVDPDPRRLPERQPAAVATTATSWCSTGSSPPIGDPREDIGYFKAVAQAAPPDLLDGERRAFCARYRELTGLDERQVNPAVLAYFLILGVVGTVRRLLEGGRDYARGDNTLLASVFNLNSVLFGGGVWLPATRQLEPVLAMMAAAEEGATGRPRSSCAR